MNPPDRSRPFLHHIVRPTLVLCGREDAITPVAVHEELAAGIHGSKLEIIEACGHLSTLGQPHQVSRVLGRWLEGIRVRMMAQYEIQA